MRRAWLLLASLTSCATPETRLRAGLVNAGVPEPLAACMADRMVGRLSLAQLRRMSDLPRAREALSVAELLHRVRALRDTEILAVTASSAALCEARLLAGRGAAHQASTPAIRSRP